MTTLEYIVNKFKVEISSSPDLPIPLRQINRTLMAQTLGELGFKEGVEVGVAEGLHARVLCEHIPPLKLHGVDIYRKYPGYEEYADPQKCFREAQDRLKSYNVIFHKQFSLDAVGQFTDRSLDFVYIDGAHDFKSVAQDICEWSKKVRLGGIVFGHDYKRWKPWKSRNTIEVRPVVDAYCYAKNIHPWFELTNDIKDPTFGPDSPGWMFVRQDADKI